jgi:ABC-type multidrug transport system fused ATPase/permease subunit
MQNVELESRMTFSFILIHLLYIYYIINTVAMKEFCIIQKIFHKKPKNIPLFHPLIRPLKEVFFFDVNLFLKFKAIKFDHASFGYRPDLPYVLNDVCFDIIKGISKNRCVWQVYFLFISCYYFLIDF